MVDKNSRSEFRLIMQLRQKKFFFQYDIYNSDCCSYAGMICGSKKKNLIHILCDGCTFCKKVGTRS